MIKKWLGIPIIAAVGIVFLWGAMLSFGTRFDCDWPSTDELIADPRLPTPSIAPGSKELADSDLVGAVVRAIARRGAIGIRFSPERDFIEQAVPNSPLIWQQRDGELVSVDQSEVLTAMENPVDLAAYQTGDYPQLFRFTITQAEDLHGCVIVEVDQPVGDMNHFAYWHLYRAGFGAGRWWVAPGGGASFGY